MLLRLVFALILLDLSFTAQKLAENILLVAKLSAFNWLLLITHILINSQHIFQEIMKIVII